jgi:hypothetical protein
VGFRHVTGRVELLLEADHYSQPMRGRGGSEPHRVRDVARPVRIRLICRTLGAGEDDRLIGADEKMSHIAALLHGVGAMGDDDPVAIRLVQSCVDAAGEGKSQGKIESKTSDIAELVHLQVDPRKRILQHGAQFLPADACNDMSGFLIAPRSDCAQW